MNNSSDAGGRDFKARLIWGAPAFQIIGLLWLLALGGCSPTAPGGQEAESAAETVARVEATSAPMATSVPVTILEARATPEAGPTIARPPAPEVSSGEVDSGGVIESVSALLVSALPIGGQTADPLAGTSWRWIAFRDMKQDFSVTGTYTIAFAGDGTVSVVADCNTGSGTYAVNGEAGLTISIRATTDAACSPGSLADAFIENLNFAGLFTIDADTLTVEIMADGGWMTFTADR